MTVEYCENCGRELGSDAIEGICPGCLAGAGIDPTDPSPDLRDLKIPPLGRLRDYFPQLEILGLIGRGGMGAVYEARQTSLDRVVALKLLPPGISRDPAFAERFAQEARALAKLNHPNIITIHDFGEQDGLFYFIMEYVDGMNLRQLMDAGRVEPREALAIAPQICDALQYAHDHGIVHRDIKPENILLDRRGLLKVADFGLAKLVASAVDLRSEGDSQSAGAIFELTEAGRIMGTPQYMAPEQKDRPSEVDHRADIYALGVVFYQMLTGELPESDLQPPSKKIQLDVRLDEVVLRALEKEPRRRYQQVNEIRTCLETVAGEPISAPNAQHEDGSGDEQCKSGTQKFIRAILPSRWYEAMRRESQGWRMVCTECGHSFSVWDAGGIRFGASGKPKRGMWCSKCRSLRFFDTVWQPEGEDSSSTRTGDQVNPASNGKHNPWEVIIILAGMLFSALMLLVAAEIPAPMNRLIILPLLVVLLVGSVSLAGLWPFDSPLFPRPNFSSRNLAGLSGKWRGLFAWFIVFAACLIVAGGLALGLLPLSQSPEERVREVVLPRLSSLSWDRRPGIQYLELDGGGVLAMDLPGVIEARTQMLNESGADLMVDLPPRKTSWSFMTPIENPTRIARVSVETWSDPGSLFDQLNAPPAALPPSEATSSPVPEGMKFMQVRGGVGWWAVMPAEKTYNNEAGADLLDIPQRRAPADPESNVFLFETADGTQGLLRIAGVTFEKDARDGLRIEYIVFTDRFIREMAGGTPQDYVTRTGDDELSGPMLFSEQGGYPLSHSGNNWNVIDKSGLRLTREDIDEIVGARNLKSLVLKDSSVSDNDLAAFRDLNSLVSADLSATLLDTAHKPRITDAGLEHVARWENLQTLRLHGLPITDEGIAQLAYLQNLRSLQLGGTQVRGAGLVALQELDRLRLDATPLQDDDLSHIARLDRLEQLYLDGTNLSNTGIRHLAGMKRLRILNLHGTRVTSEGVAYLEAKMPGIIIGWDGNTAIDASDAKNPGT